MNILKKLISFAVLSGLLLGTTAPVFATEITAIEGTDSSNSTPVTSEIAATYTVTVPEALSINLMGGVSVDSGNVMLSNLTADGSVIVTATVEDLKLAGGTGLANETLTTTIVAAGTTIIDQTSTFSLTNSAATQGIQVVTAEESKNNLPGNYTGAINFTFDYEPAAAQ